MRNPVSFRAAKPKSIDGEPIGERLWLGNLEVSANLAREEVVYLAVAWNR